MYKPIDLDKVRDPQTQGEWRIYTDIMNLLERWGIPIVGVSLSELDLYASMCFVQSKFLTRRNFRGWN
ncbi:unnamed protein product [Strongylus vulgaris]|uniref:Uncharacterized protein n=1 Tax=Strongylus vulgaris TaxID=40348 RepID=A0A3P7LDA9_STRVU|nr:unnamed protein product [Strongylus vulgaris]